MEEDAVVTLKHHVWQLSYQAYYVGHTHTIKKQGGGSVILWGCFSPTEMGLKEGKPFRSIKRLEVSFQQMQHPKANAKTNKESMMLKNYYRKT